MITSPDSLLPLLKKYFGFTTFRPLQQEIILDTLANRDVFALLPTGGGKSMCFQLPALISGGLTLVISPLIALMKDQVDSLQAAGVPATFLNSSLGSEEARARLRGLHQGQYRLLYVAPERLLAPGFFDDLQKWKVDRIAVDEAHCISEWGHDFRPEYRQLAPLRQQRPEIPWMALTATATERVRADILKQLHLRDPQCYVASFNRPNLTYRVAPRVDAYGQLRNFLQARPKESGIIYCQARRTTESLAARLVTDGVAAAPYHAELPREIRSRNQESFLRDETRVICATIAFGMGINKPNVRFVVHYDLPKNIEGFYQETGRAGRDSLPSECLLLFSPGDVVKHQRFIDEKPDPKERENARAQLNKIVHFAESTACRRTVLLNYFGETYPDASCGGCDNCLTPRESYDGTTLAHKFLSCVFRIRQHSGFGTGLAHVIEVLTGADSNKVRQMGHHEISTYGIGRDRSRPEWGAIGRELIRLGYLLQDSNRWNIVELTAEGLSVLKQRKPVSLSKPLETPLPTANRSGNIPCDESLFESLRQLRKRLADERQLPPYIVFSDVTVRQMARNYPVTEAEFRRIQGVGEVKYRDWGAAFMEEITRFLREHPRQVFADDSFLPMGSRARLNDTARDSLARFRTGQSVEAIARDRKLAPGTIYTHLATAIECGELIDPTGLWTIAQEREIEAAFAKTGSANITGALELLGPSLQYGQLKIYRAIQETKRQQVSNDV